MTSISSISDLAARLQSAPLSAERDKAIIAFTKKYPNYLSQLRYSNDPVGWVQTELREFVWSKQAEILNSVRDNRRTAVKSCHGAGKSFIAARIAAWWLSCHPLGQARVVTSAPTGDQVKAILWHEISRAHAAGNLIGRLNQTEWWVNVGDHEEMVGIGRKPSDHSTSSFQGIHERWVLVILDEACGIPKSLWTQAEGLLSNDECRLLSIGNPDDPDTEFFNECKPGSGSNVIKISAFDTPNFTGEQIPDKVRHNLVGQTWVEEKKTKWGESSPLYISRVLGEFPENSEDSLIPISWVRAAQERSITPSLPVRLGIDVGGGGDKNVIALSRGRHVRIARKDQNPDTMKTLSNALEVIKSTGASTANIDRIGIGKGAADRAAEMAKDQEIIRDNPNLADRANRIIGVSVGSAAIDKTSFVNLRAEGYWKLREDFNPDNEDAIDIDPKDDILASQLTSIKYHRSAGRIQIQSKQEMEKSPDEADAVMLSRLDLAKMQPVEVKKRARMLSR